MSEVSASLVAGKQITKAVSLLSPLSSGGMGAVWLADHLGLKTRVVVKFMLIGLDSNDSARTRFSREAAAAAQVKSPHVVQMLDHGLTDDGVPFIVMEHLEGHDLGDEIEKNGAVDPGKVVAIVSQVAKALSKVHAAGLLHRDIKPDNIFICAGEEETFVKLLDFGIAKSSALDGSDDSLSGETKTGQVVGTPFYMSPEQVTASKVIDHRSDLWALGVVAYEALTGHRPYDGPSFGALAVKIATGSPPKATEANPSLPPMIDQWFAKACARDPGARFSSAKEMAEAFRAVFEGVVSLPSSAQMSSDSGQRGANLSSSSGERNANASGGGGGSGTANSASSGSRRQSGGDLGTGSSGSRSASPTFGLAATALPEEQKHVALGRSEAGVSVVGGDARPEKRSSPLLFIAVAVVLTAGGVGAFLWSAKSNANNNTGGGGGGGGGGTTPSMTVSASASAPSASSSVPTAVVSVGVEPPAVRDAGPTTTAASIPTKIPTGRPTGGGGGHHASSGGAQPKPSNEPPPTKPPAKPASSEPDLF